MHIVDPKHYPLSPDAAYIPPTHTLSDATAFESSVGTTGIPNIVLVQPSIYGFDNSCLLDGLRAVGPARGRGVVTINPETIDGEQLDEWHKLGVRGVRLNLQSTGKKVEAGELVRTVQRHADLIRPYNWVLQLYVALSMIPILEPAVPGLGVKVCFDHFGSPVLPRPLPAQFDPYSLAGFSSLVSLLEQGNTYVKISAPYRLTNDSQFGGLREMAQEFMRVGRDRVVFATDWPHTRFDGMDITPFVEACVEWCRAESGLAERLFRRNAEELWDVEASE